MPEGGRWRKGAKVCACFWAKWRRRENAPVQPAVVSRPRQFAAWSILKERKGLSLFLETTMATLEMDFGQAHFGGCDLGHRARSRCLVKIANAIHRHPGDTLPHKLHAPKDYKAMVRLMNRPETTHAAVLAGHVQRTQELLRQAEGPVLILHDTTELDYSGLGSIGELGSIGANLGRGYLCHNSLAYDLQQQRVLGLAQQILHPRKIVGRKEGTRRKRERRSRESRLWPNAVTAVGLAPAGRLWVHVADRGSDTFEHLAQHVCDGSAFVLRSLGRRKIQPGHDGLRPARTLRKYARALPVQSSQTVVIGARAKQAKEEATVGVAWSEVLVHPPHVRRGEYEKKPLPLWLVVVREERAPKGRQALEWILLTNVPVTTAAQAWERVRWYECRWVIEEYHKAQKTGCAIERLQFSSAQALQPMIALLSVVAVTLLNLRDASRNEAAAQRPATEYVARRYIEVLSAWRYPGREFQAMTVREFYLALARLGGHQNRKGDHPPGWVVLWRGWTDLQHMLDGAEAIGLEIRGQT